MEFYTIQIPPKTPPRSERHYFDLNIESDANFSFTNMFTGEKFCHGDRVAIKQEPLARAVDLDYRIIGFKLHETTERPVYLHGKVFDECVWAEYHPHHWTPLKRLKLRT